MELVHFLINFILHVDKHLAEFVQNYGMWVYALLFLIVFVETGLVVMPFLPGDSLLFVVGALAGTGAMSLPVAMGVLLVAAIAGDQLNYTIGRYIGPKVFQWEDSRWFNRKAFNAAHNFYEKHGGVTIILARFMPFIRTFAPFVAGVAEMDRGKFTTYNVVGDAQANLAKLKRLEDDNLPAFEDRFFGLLRDQSDQNLTLLATKLDEERSAIRARMELVNESLETAPFNSGTHLVIETTDKSLEDVRLFRASLRDSLSHSFSNDRDLAEERFKALASLVKRLASQETVDKNWRNLVLDVRQHVEFVARELDEDGIEVEVYRSGAGKSGGQRQKLAATCLAAALRYQLGGQDRALPSYSTVVLDEAFDKADAEFTAMAMNIFKTFGFQMIVATPLKSVMTLEPFIGGACFVHIKDRKKSAVIPIEYDGETQRLKLTQDVRHAEEASVS